jgi:hypothetical protein
MSGVSSEQKKWFMYLGVIFLVGFTAWWIFTSYDFENCVDQSAQQATNQKQPSTSVVIIYRDCVGKVINSGGDAVTAIATIVIAFLTVALASATNRLRDIANKQEWMAAQQLKAYVFPVRQELEAEPRAGDSVKVNLLIRNVGHTPAHDVRIDGDIAVADFPLRPGTLRELDFSTNADISRQVLGPGGEREKQQVSKVLTVEEAKAIYAENPTMAIYVYGLILYHDEFGLNRWTRYRYFWNGDIGKLRSRNLAADSDGNEADREAVSSS